MPAKSVPPVVEDAAPYVMPAPPAVVVWRNAPNGSPSYAIVTKVGRYAISLLLFHEDSVRGERREGVRFIGDPWTKANGINADSGVWEFTAESLMLRALISNKEATPGSPAK